MSELATWTIYDRPDDYPTRVVVRQHIVASGIPVPAEAFWTNTVEEAIAVLERGGLVALGRQPEDHPCVVGSWV